MARSPIPSGITREDVLQAMVDLDAGTVRHGFHDSERYDLVYEGRRYPPKAVLGVAARRVVGSPLAPSDFTGGEGSTCFRILRSLGFAVDLKSSFVASGSLTYHSFNVGKPATDAWWARNVSMNIVTAGYSNAPGDRGDVILHDINAGDWVLAYVTGKGFVGAGIAAGPDTYRIVEQAALPDGFESSTHRQFATVTWIYWVPRVGDAVTRAEANFHPVAAKAKIQDKRVAETIIRLIAARGEKAASATLLSEGPSDIHYAEGAVHQVLVDRYERNSDARSACIAHWGTHCHVCSFDFGTKFGPLGEGFIHVHHMRPISAAGERHEVDPIADLRPVCPNCHAMLHRTTPPMDIAILRQHMVGG